MSQNPIFHAQRIERVRDGMRVVDAAGTELGTVAYIKGGDPEADTIKGETLDDPASSSLIRTVGIGGTGLFSHDQEPNVPDPLRKQLLRLGFIKVHGPGLLTHHDRYVRADRIIDVTEDTVTVVEADAEGAPLSAATSEQSHAHEPAPSTLTEVSGSTVGASTVRGAPPAWPAPTSRPSWQETPAPAFQAAQPRWTLFAGIGVAVLASIGTAWLYLRWQRERNKPINRARRQVKQVTTAVSERLPSASELAALMPDRAQVKPAGTLGLPVLLAALLYFARARRAEAPSEEPLDQVRGTGPSRNERGMA